MKYLDNRIVSKVRKYKPFSIPTCFITNSDLETTQIKFHIISKL